MVDAVRAAHERFVTTGHAPGRHVRRLVVDSWRRSARSGVDPEFAAAPVDMAGRTLTGYRRQHPLAGAMPVVRDLLVTPGADAGWVTALTDDVGRMLWVEGDGDVRRRVEGVGFVEGAVWREDCAGTNALGTALVTDRPVQVVGTEHFARRVQPWNCAAAPVHAPSGQVLGVLDVTGGSIVASALAMSLVRATVAAVEAELARAAGVDRAGPTQALALGHLRGSAAGAPVDLTAMPPTVPPVGPAARLRVLGAGEPVLRIAGAPVRLSLRHAEILLLLAAHPAGLSADELAVLLSAHDLSDVTVRAEVSRLRRSVGPLMSASRPYRLTAPVPTDIDLVRSLLDAGDTSGALASYPGPVLARSVAPGVEQLRDELTADVRAAVLVSRSPEVVSRWLASDEGAEDWQAWEHLAWLSPRGTPAHARALGRLDLLTRRLG
ncbi:transcriptional regulator [Cellulomonas chitinilytica]|uniref:Transcriptional regulator n=1 Tax=Cellulomonas chitinilytica TaxID=398759 RepID=A0A919U4I4_9CELL|nr:GAF domain-containing protein [Cellulomonas chitinilytica]GIG23482.1 transcriptional regulator [Cellulomonas chitinilytica]